VLDLRVPCSFKVATHSVLTHCITRWFAVAYRSKMLPNEDERLYDGLLSLQTQ
jgi:hypothetical protein